MKIYHHPRCSTSRYVLAAIRDAGVEPEIIEYMKTPLSRDELAKIATTTGLGIKGLLRKRATEYKELGLANTDDDAIYDAIAAHPVLIERPIVVDGDHALLARPKDTIHEFLANRHQS